MTSYLKTSLSDFGILELKALRDILGKMINDGLPSDFINDEVNIFFNSHSGFVFLSNSEFQVAMINPDSKLLESYYTCLNCGYESFYSDIDHNSNDFDCQEYIKSIKYSRTEAL